MENRFNRDFEQFLKQNADQYRMYPSEKVWKGIYHSLHGRRRWIALGLSLFTLTIVSVTWIMLSSPSPSPATQEVQHAVKLNTSPTEVAVNANENMQKPQIIGPSSKSLKNTNPLLTFLDDYEVETPGNDLAEVAKISITKDEFESSIINETNIAIRNESPVSVLETKELILPQPIFITDQTTDNDPVPGNYISSIKEPGEIKNLFSYDVYPMSIESVVNSFKAKLKKKISIQAYVAPTISYRSLSENKSFLSTTSNSFSPNPAAIDVKRAVTHKPAIGLELGVAAKYPLSKNINVRGGIQFNISRYDIKAFTFNGEVATIALDDGSGNNSVYRWTKYRNFNGYSSNWLQNYYFSVSAPVGIEVRIAGNKKTSFGVAGTIQPTYVLRDKAYLLSTDFKNYAQVPWLIRRWNANTSFETFVNYSSGSLKWQVGPQVRYQLMSSFQDKYPVKENLFDFGLKVGIMLNQ